MISEKSLEKLNECLDWIDFNAERDGEQLRLIDKQNAYLGNINKERFNTCNEVLERMDVYWNDVFLNPEILLNNSDLKAFESLSECCEYIKKHNIQGLDIVFTIANGIDDNL